MAPRKWKWPAASRKAMTKVAPMVSVCIRRRTGRSTLAPFAKDSPTVVFVALRGILEAMEGKLAGQQCRECCMRCRIGIGGQLNAIQYRQFQFHQFQFKYQFQQFQFEYQSQLHFGQFDFRVGLCVAQSFSPMLVMRSSNQLRTFAICGWASPTDTGTWDALTKRS